MLTRVSDRVGEMSLLVDWSSQIEFVAVAVFTPTAPAWIGEVYAQ